MGLLDRGDQPSGSLNVAQKKRLEMARALAARPYLLLLDEVLAGLNPSEIASMMATVRAIREDGISILMIEHVMQAIMSISDRILVLDYGTLIATGLPEEVANNPQVIEAYLGDPENDGATAGGVDYMAILEVNDIASGYEGVQILWGVNLKLEPGKLTTLVGSNGVGKTTLLKTVMGLMAPINGSVSFQGEDVTNLSAHARANAGMVLVPEGRQLFTEMTIYENLEMGAFSPRARATFNQNLDKVYELFPRLKERTRQKAGTLSGGEQQMVAVGRGLMAEPEVLMLDELSLGLSPLLALTLFEALTRLKKTGLTMLLVEQNVTMALAVSDYAYVLAEGKVHLEGPARELSKNDEVRRTYLGI